MDYNDIKKLIDDMGNSKIDELEIEFPEGMKISMKKSKEVEVVQTSAPVVAQNVTNNNTDVSNEELKIVKSPMVGTCYLSPSPKEAEFVKVGDKVTKGKTLCIIEAMKLMNEIGCEYDGEIVEVCVKNEEMVEFGKPLFKIK